MAEAVVIGANGFIGSHLVDGLAAAGHSVRAFDRFSSRRPTFDAPAEVMVGEFLSRGDIESAVSGQDYVFHFLSTTTPATAETDPTLDIRTNLAQTVELLEASVQAGVRRVYFASTGGAIYGDQGKTVYSEKDPTEPASPYAIGKLAIEQYLRFFRVKHGLASTALRISNPYGTRQHPSKKQGLIPIALRQILTGKPVVQFGDGSMVRDYLYVEDLVRMIVPMVEHEPAHDVYNIGSGSGHSVNEVLDALRRVTNIDFDIERREKPATFVEHVVLDGSRYRTEFGEVELTPLDEGIRRTFAEMKGENL
ncbi:NAD-dependent epimerase/dehydratase family protein [Leifsonia sp. 21MFCrub1.1]|uniref:NAD-dependent epimerase/dehydratase family protein n=1 Tax=Leifsonia sp. 21MFCrub1.1 TaxID=1798223 RepID=UPI000892875A|nr:NAD-dependent epimerase/dehydratase family protein [Leifsonia sp. 21MFCrub1.1]SEB00722.1 UDP-glucose 4-epimerase [Leifsonia sp. 21MFCrub1.1]